MFGPSYRDFLQKVGWTKICDPDFEMTEEVYQELETYGLSRQLVDAMRAFNALPQRERAVRSITNNLYQTWIHYLRRGDGKRNCEAPDISGTRWRDVPCPGFWDAQRSEMEQFNITVDEIESRILNDPQQYPHNIRWPLSLMDEAESANLIRQQSER